MPSTDPGPIRIAIVDLEEPLPALDDVPGYEQVWVVGRRAGVPVALVEVDLKPVAPPVEDQLAPLRQAGATAAPRGRPVPDAELPRITVVVPSVIARTDELARCLGGFDRLDYPDFEVLLVDNRRQLPTPDPLPDLLREHASVRPVRAARPGISAARNAGLAAATGEVVVFTDDDVHVDHRWLRAVGERFVRQPELEAVTGLILPAELETPAQVFFERYYGGFSGERTFAPLTLAAGPGLCGRSRVTVRDAAGNPVRSFALYGVGAYGAGANMAFRRETLRRLGGFDLALGTGTPARGGEDLALLVDLLWRGGRIGYEPAAVVHHQHRREYAELVHQLRGNGLGFTAMLASVVSRDPRHLLALGAQLPLAARRMAAQSVARLQGRRAGAADPAVQAVPAAPLYPAELVRYELGGMPRGPWAYLRSRRDARDWTAPPGSADEQLTGGVPSGARGGRR